MILLTHAARLLKAELEKAAHCPVSGVRVSISARWREPYMVGGIVRLPLFVATDPEIDFGRTWRHELQHARDWLDGLTSSLTGDELERRASIAEHFDPDVGIVQAADRAALKWRMT